MTEQLSQRVEDPEKAHAMASAEDLPRELAAHAERDEIQWARAGRGPTYVRMSALRHGDAERYRNWAREAAGQAAEEYDAQHK